MVETDVDFPKTLPSPLIEGKSAKTVKPFTRTNMESGRARQRRRFSSVPTLVRVEWIFNSPQAQAFESWFRDSTTDGSDWFNMRIKMPLGFGPYVCRFVDMYDGPDQMATRYWRYSAELEIWERPLLPPGWGIVPDLVAGMDIIDLAVNREWPE